MEDRRDPAYTYQTRPLQMDGVTMPVLGVAALDAVRGYLWVQAGETWKAVLMGMCIAAALADVGWGKGGRRPASASMTRSSSKRRSPASPSTPSLR